LYSLYWNRSIYATVASIAVVAVVVLMAVGAIRSKRKQTNTRPPPVVRSPLVAGVYKVTFKVILISYQYDEIKLQNMFTFLGWGKDFCLTPSENIFSDIMAKIRYLLMRLACLFYITLTRCVVNPTYTPTTLTEEEILDNHRSVLCSCGISTKDEELDLPSLY